MTETDELRSVFYMLTDALPEETYINVELSPDVDGWGIGVFPLGGPAFAFGVAELHGIEYKVARMKGHSELVKLCETVLWRAVDAYKAMLNPVLPDSAAKDISEEIAAIQRAAAKMNPTDALTPAGHEKALKTVWTVTKGKGGWDIIVAPREPVPIPGPEPRSAICPCGITRSDCDYHR